MNVLYRVYEGLMDILEDAHLARIVKERAGEEEIAVNIDEL
jgi:hypothetical protein